MLTIMGACVFVYFAIRVVATIIDVYQRWRNDDWEVE